MICGKICPQLTYVPQHRPFSGKSDNFPNWRLKQKINKKKITAGKMKESSKSYFFLNTKGFKILSYIFGSITQNGSNQPKWKFSTFCGLPGTTSYPYPYFFKNDLSYFTYFVTWTKLGRKFKKNLGEGTFVFLFCVVNLDPTLWVATGVRRVNRSKWDVRVASGPR